ncbi:hypothetical protein TNCV_240931 [Trichonephila clavipes]|nr:hypothetical protein TNCV_240931 [Trichonephila clavipes]
MAVSSKTPPHQSKDPQKFKTPLQVPVFPGSSPLCHHTKSEKPSDTTSFHSVLKSLLESNTCGLVRGYDGFEIIESSPETTAVPGNEGGHYCAALAPPLELEVEGPD